jgi:hypothetical protein
MKTKVDAICDLMREARAERGSTTAARRAVSACKVLGLNDDDTRRVMTFLDYCGETGEPYSKSIERVWP